MDYRQRGDVIKAPLAPFTAPSALGRLYLSDVLL